MKNYQNLIYALLCLSFTMIVGAGVYEHLAVWPRAFHAPPQSLTMFQGEFGLNAVAFWGKIHPFTLLLFVATLILSWKTERKKYVLIPFLGYIIVMIATFTYFVPDLLEITNTTYAEDVNQELVQRGSTWEILSMLRLALMIVLALFLYLGLTKPHHKNS